MFELKETKETKNTPNPSNEPVNIYPVGFVWESSDIFEIPLEIERYGGACHWNKIVIRRGEGEDKEEVYSITLEGEVRKEFFFGKLSRKYRGDKNCFIEYIHAVEERKGLLTPIEATRGLNRRMERLYRENLERMLYGRFKSQAS